MMIVIIIEAKSSQFWEELGWTSKYPTSQLAEYPSTQVSN